jgi:hypothetical protein
MSRVSSVLVLVGTLLLASPARAIQTSGPEVWPGKIELAAHVGGQVGIGNYWVDGRFFGGPPGGFKLFLDFSYRVNNIDAYSVWLNMGVNFVIGGGCSFNGPNYLCNGASNGDGIEPFFGVKLKFRTPVPLVPYVRLDGTFVGIVNRYCGDDGFAIGARVGGGLKYFLTKNIGLGIDTGFVLGPGFYSGANGLGCLIYRNHVEFYGSWDMGIGAEFVF